MNTIKFVLVLALVLLGNAFAQTSVDSTAVGATATVAPTAADPDAMSNLAAQKWLQKDKFQVLWNMPGFREESYTASPKAGKFAFHGSNFCNAGGAYDAVYSVDKGQLLIAVTRSRVGCGVVELRFDLTTLQGTLETVINGQRATFPNMKVQLKD